MDEQAELEQLQRRAYGPEPDLDAEGLARLRELQDAARVARAARHGGAGQAAPAPHLDATRSEPVPEAPAPDPVVSESAASEPAPDNGPADAPPRAKRSEAAASSWWRRPVVLIGAGAAAGMALMGAMAAAVAAGEAPAAVLHVTDEKRPSNIFSGAYDAIVYDLYAGIDVRSTATAGGACLSAYHETTDAGGQLLSLVGDIGCAPPGVAPTVELWAGTGPLGWSTGDIEGVASGTYLRFELDGDVVNVWRHDPATPSPTPADG